MTQPIHSFDPGSFGKVALLMGGWSAEREISLQGGKAVLAALRQAGVDVEPVDVDRNIAQVLQTKRFDRIFNMLHGRGGEDGVIQGLLNVLELPYTGSGVLGCAIAMDKLRTKYIWSGLGLPTPDSYVLNKLTDCEKVVEKLGLPLIVKPVFEGSSIGISKVNKVEELMDAWRDASEYGLVMAEKWVNGIEYTTGILENKGLPLIRLETTNQFYDYDAKYCNPVTQYHCPSGLSLKFEDELMQMCVDAFLAVGASGWGRVDFILDEAEKPWLIEVNTVPGMTDHSLVPMAAKAKGIDFEELVIRILATSMKNNDQGEAYVT